MGGSMASASPAEPVRFSLVGQVLVVVLVAAGTVQGAGGWDATPFDASRGAMLLVCIGYLGVLLLRAVRGRPLAARHALRLETLGLGVLLAGALWSAVAAARTGHWGAALVFSIAATLQATLMSAIRRRRRAAPASADPSIRRFPA
jgi:hypothetical protein